jgi:SAM-dependent methyltransferase
MHQIYLSLLSSRLTIVPIPPNVTHILDIGTGTGEWAINMAETYQSAEIIGTDISAIQPKAVPSNVYFEIDDAQLDWEFSHQFDFIHIRGLAGAFDDWSTVYAQAFKFLKPGGYIEIIDHGPSVVPGLLQSPTVVALREAFQVACAVSGRPFNTDHLNPSILEAVGFTEVTTVENKMLLGGNVPPTDGSNDWKQKFGLVSFLESVESSVLRPLTRTAGWAVEDVKEAIETSKQQLAVLANQPEGGYTPVYFVVAKKPL